MRTHWFASIIAAPLLVGGCTHKHPDPADRGSPRPQVAGQAMPRPIPVNGFELLGGDAARAISGRQRLYIVRPTDTTMLASRQRLWANDNYIRARVHIERVGGTATYATDTSTLQRLIAGVHRTTHQYAALVSVSTNASPDAALVIPVVQSQSSANRPGNPTVNDATVVLLPTLLHGVPSFTVTAQYGWGERVETQLAGIGLQVFQTAAGLASGLPAPIAAAAAGIGAEQRQKANEAVSGLLSSGAPAAPVSLTLTADELRDARAVLVVIYDRDAIDPDAQEVLRYRIEFEPMASLLTFQVKADGAADYTNMSETLYSRPFLGLRETSNVRFPTPRSVVQHAGHEQNLSEWTAYVRLCQEGPLLFSSHGFNTNDSNVLTWAALRYAGPRLRPIPANADGTSCPEADSPILTLGLPRAVRVVPPRPSGS